MRIHLDDVMLGFILELIFSLFSVVAIVILDGEDDG